MPIAKNRSPFNEIDMDTKRIMIGDWVYNTYKKKNIQWTPQDFFMHINGHITDRIVLGRDIEPIPITNEILEKNGFELKPDGWLWSNEGLEDQNYIFIQFRKGCEGVRNCEINFIHRAQVTFKQLYFVHELQHALKLCGIPKTIVL